MPEACQKYTRSKPEAFQVNFKFPETCKKHATSMPQACHKPTTSMPQARHKYATSMPQVCNKHTTSKPQKIPEECLSFWVFQKIDRGMVVRFRHNKEFSPSYLRIRHILVHHFKMYCFRLELQGLAWVRG